jgi:hypothetical protein
VLRHHEADFSVSLLEAGGGVGGAGHARCSLSSQKLRTEWERSKRFTGRPAARTAPTTWPTGSACAPASG